MLMIILAQFPSTRWIAVLMSDNGQPYASLIPPPSQPPSVQGMP
jgi:hypothetical protein